MLFSGHRCRFVCVVFFPCCVALLCPTLDSVLLRKSYGSESFHHLRAEELCAPTSSVPRTPISLLSSRCTWHDRVNQLLEYKEKHGDTLVPKRYPENPSLGNWVNKQRQQYRKYQANEKPCSLTPAKVQELVELGFCWDGTVKVHDQIEEAWWNRLGELKVQISNSQEFTPTMSAWLRQQRKGYANLQQDLESKLDENKIQALNETLPGWWKSFHERQWEERYKELVEYRDEYGDCCVPINFMNRKLANWVSNQRKNFKVKSSGRFSKLTNEQIDLLNDIGFAWNRWDYEYEKKLGDIQEKLSNKGLLPHKRTAC